MDLDRAKTMPDGSLFGGDESDLSDLEEQDVVLSDDEQSDSQQLAEHDGLKRPSRAQEDETIYDGEDLEGNGKPLRRKRRKGEVKKVRQKRPKAEDAVLERMDEAGAAKVRAFREDFDQAVKSLSSIRRKKRDVDVQDTERMISSIRDKMKQAAELDVRAHYRKEPAVHKLKLLPSVLKELERSDMHEYFLDADILNAFQMWLEPLSDGSLPLYDLRRALFTVLAKLPVATDHLRESKIGPLVMFYTKCPRETPELQKAAKDLITRWSRPVLHISDSYRDMRTSSQVVDLEQERSKARSTLSQSSASQPSDFMSQMPSTYSSTSQRARVPVPMANSYVVRPMSNVEQAMDSKKKKSETYKKLERHMTRLKQTGK